MQGREGHQELVRGHACRREGRDTVRGVQPVPECDVPRCGLPRGYGEQEDRRQPLLRRVRPDRVRRSVRRPADDRVSCVQGREEEQGRRVLRRERRPTAVHEPVLRPRRDDVHHAGTVACKMCADRCVQKDRKCTCAMASADACSTNDKCASVTVRGNFEVCTNKDRAAKMSCHTKTQADCSGACKWSGGSCISSDEPDRPKRVETVPVTLGGLEDARKGDSKADVDRAIKDDLTESSNKYIKDEDRFKDCNVDVRSVASDGTDRTATQVNLAVQCQDDRTTQDASEKLSDWRTQLEQGNDADMKTQVFKKTDAKLKEQGKSDTTITSKPRDTTEARKQEARARSREAKKTRDAAAVDATAQQDDATLTEPQRQEKKRAARKVREQWGAAEQKEQAALQRTDDAQECVDAMRKVLGDGECGLHRPLA